MFVLSTNHLQSRFSSWILCFYRRSLIIFESKISNSTAYQPVATSELSNLCRKRRAWFPCLSPRKLLWPSGSVWVIRLLFRCLPQKKDELQSCGNDHISVSNKLHISEIALSTGIVFHFVKKRHTKRSIVSSGPFVRLWELFERFQLAFRWFVKSSW